MRVFYIDEEEMKQSKRAYYVKVDNINVSADLIGYKVIEAETTEELKKKIRYLYNFKEEHNFQLWTSAGYTGRRLDEMEIIPMEYEFIWIRGVLNKDNK